MIEDLAVYITPTVLAVLGWLIRRTMQSADNNTKALITEVGELTKVVASMTTNNAVVLKTLETLNKEQNKTNTKQEKLVIKVDEVESKVDSLKGFCEAKHNVVPKPTGG